MFSSIDSAIHSGLHEGATVRQRLGLDCCEPENGTTLTSTEGVAKSTPRLSDKDFWAQQCNTSNILLSMNETCSCGKNCFQILNLQAISRCREDNASRSSTARKTEALKAIANFGVTNQVYDMYIDVIDRQLNWKPFRLN
jgi:hypothetical protein